MATGNARRCRVPERLLNWILIGVWVAVAGLAKVNGLLFIGVAGLMLIICAWRACSWALLFKGGIGMSLPIVAATTAGSSGTTTCTAILWAGRAYIDYVHKILRDNTLDFEEVRSFLTIQFYILSGAVRLDESISAPMVLCGYCGALCGRSCGANRVSGSLLLEMSRASRSLRSSVVGL